VSENRAPTPSAFLGCSAGRPGPSKTAPRRRIVFRCAAGDWFRLSIATDPARHKGRQEPSCGVVFMDCGKQPAQPSRASASQLPSPGRRGLQVTQPSLVAGRRMGSRGRPPASFAGRATAANQARATGRVTPGTGHLRPFRPTVGSSPGRRPLCRRRRRRGQRNREESEEPDAAQWKGFLDAIILIRGSAAVVDHCPGLSTLR
jgi:hypothetical protein